MPGGVTTRYIGSAEEAIGDLLGHGFAVEHKGNVRFDAARIVPSKSQKRWMDVLTSAHPAVAVSIIQPPVSTESSRRALAGSQVVTIRNRIRETTV